MSLRKEMDLMGSHRWVHHLVLQGALGDWAM
jgi:hypothetical protein